MYPTLENDLFQDSPLVVYWQDVATLVIAEGLKPKETLVSKVMTRNCIFVRVETLAVEVLQKMVQGEYLILCEVLIVNSVTEIVPGYLWQYNHMDIVSKIWQHHLEVNFEIFCVEIIVLGILYCVWFWIILSTPVQRIESIWLFFFSKSM